MDLVVGGEGGEEDVPVCMEVNAPVALKATLSQMPEMAQHAMRGMSAWRVSISLRRWPRRPCDGGGFTLCGGGSCCFGCVGVAAPELVVVVVVENGSIALARNEQRESERVGSVLPPNSKSSCWCRTGSLTFAAFVCNLQITSLDRTTAVCIARSQCRDDSYVFLPLGEPPLHSTIFAFCYVSAGPENNPFVTPRAAHRC
jgi:hypothetical protein